MNSHLGGLIAWLLVWTIPVFLLLGSGLVKVFAAKRRRSREEPKTPLPPIEILVPLKGIFKDQQQILFSLLEQRYNSYHVVFILESLDDPANYVVDNLCRQYRHARKVISGTSTLCAQKNHNLVEGVRQLRPETEIIVFCDSTNAAPQDWLMQFTEPLRKRSVEVRTTFRAFDPEPQTLAGVCQAIYGTLILLITTIVPKPWGGATAIRRMTFDKLDVIETWSKTVVDDLVLGNLLQRAGIKVAMDPCNILKSPLKNQTTKGFLNYLDRQIMFPKFTNPLIWAMLMIMYLNLTLAVTVTILSGSMSLFGLVSREIGLMSVAFLLALFVLAVMVWRIAAPHISLKRWLPAILPMIFLGAFIFIRSIFRNYIDWHGRTYWCGKGGTVLFVESSSNNSRKTG
jgi:hypothetical protein